MYERTGELHDDPSVTAVSRVAPLIMSKLFNSPTLLTITAILSGGYEVLSFFGLPPYSQNPWVKTLALAILVTALSRLIYEDKKKIGELSDPNIEFSLTHKSVLQRDASLHAWYRRVCLANRSDHPARNCELAIESWSFKTIQGLSADTALIVKDLGVYKTDVNKKNSKQFDLFVSVLDFGKDSVLATKVGAPNYPEIVPDDEKHHEIVLRLTGAFNVRRWRVLFTIRGKDVEITDIKPLHD